MRKLSILLIILLPLFVFAQTPSLQQSAPLAAAPPESVGMSAERLARIDAICEQAVARQDVPGIVALVARRGKIVYHKAFGESGRSQHPALREDDIFRIASQTKAITATAVMMLWEEGRFRLDDPISKWIPEFKNPQVLTKFHYRDTSFTAVPAKGEITIRHLLTHTSGIGYGLIDPDEGFQLLYQKAGIREIASVDPLTTAENIKKLASLPLHFHPGEKYQYSMGLDVLAYFVEIISGMPFDRFLHTRLFEPLDMQDTYFYLPPKKAKRLVALQEPSADGWKVSQREGPYDPDYPLNGVRTLFSGGGGLSSTARDYATFLQMYLNGGELNGTRILSRTTIQSMMANQIGELWGKGDSHYGLAFGVVTDKGEGKGGMGSEGTFSWGGAFNTQYFADPEEELIGVILKQTRGAWKDQTGWQFRQLVEQAVVNPGQSPPLAAAPPERVGMSSSRLAHIDRMCKEAIAAHKIPGAVALVARNGKIVYHKAFGTADPLTGRALRKDDIFRIASQTKAITATAVMMLWEEGHFRLDDPISKWIPEFKNPKVLKSFRYSDTTYTTVPAEREITIRHLLTHTSGIGYGAIDPHEGMQILFDRAGIEEFAPQREWSTADNIKQLASLPLHFQPGEKYQYGMGLDVLVYLVEIITGKPFEAFLQQRLFGPLGMEDTYFHLPKEKADRLVKVQEPRDSTWVLHQPTGYDPDYPLTCPPSFCSGGAGLVSTATDYATFLQMYLNGGELNGVQILSPTTIKAIMANQIGDFWGDAGKYYGLAFGVVNANGVAKAGIGSEGTFDWGGYFNTQYFADPEEQVIGIILKQSFFTWGDPTGWQFRQIVGQAIDDDPQGRNMSR